MATINKLITLIKGFEGLVLSVYRDNVGNLTAGYGSLISSLPAPYNKLIFGAKITLAQAESWLVSHLETSGINAWLKTTSLNDNQKAAAASFFYQHGLSHPDTKSKFISPLSYWSMQEWFYKNWDNNNLTLKDRNFRTIHYYFNGVLLPVSTYAIRKASIDANIMNDNVTVTSKKKVIS